MAIANQGARPSNRGRANGGTTWIISINGSLAWDELVFIRAFIILSNQVLVKYISIAISFPTYHTQLKHVITPF